MAKNNFDNWVKNFEIEKKAAIKTAEN